MKINNTTVLHGSEMQVSLPRVGTRCKICNEAIDVQHPETWVHSSTPNQPSIYVHRSCIRTRRYHEPFTSPSGVTWELMNDKRKTTSDAITITAEIEAWEFFGDWDNLEERATFLAQFGLFPEHDSSVWREFHEKATPNLHGKKERYREMEKYINMTDEHCGHHLNGSWYDMTESDMRKLRNNANALFGDVQTVMRNSPLATERVFGRYFTHYAEDNDTFCKWDYSWLNLEKPSCIELRLVHYVNPEQITWCFFLFKEWIKICRRFCKNEITAERASKLIYNVFAKHAKGEATCQRKLQNSKI